MESFLERTRKEFLDRIAVSKCKEEPSVLVGPLQKMAKLRVKIKESFINTVDYETYVQYNPIDAVLQSKEYYEEFFLNATVRIIGIRNLKDRFQDSFQNPKSIKKIAVETSDEDFIFLPPWAVYEILKGVKEDLV